MIKVTDLPREPNAALISIIESINVVVGTSNSIILHLRQAKHPLFLEFKTAMIVAVQAAKRISDPQLREIALEYLEYGEAETLGNVSARLETLHGTFVSMDMDNHFLDANDVSDFDCANVDQDQREIIRAALSEARVQATGSNVLQGRQKRRICHYIAKAENELLKDKVGLQAFLAAAYEMSDLTNKFGNDVKPIAEAIEIARTTTQRNVEGYKQIEADEPPKRIEGPKED